MSFPVPAGSSRSCWIKYHWVGHSITRLFCDMETLLATLLSKMLASLTFMHPSASATACGQYNLATITAEFSSLKLQLPASKRWPYNGLKPGFQPFLPRSQIFFAKKVLSPRLKFCWRTLIFLWNFAWISQFFGENESELSLVSQNQI